MSGPLKGKAWHDAREKARKFREMVDEIRAVSQRADPPDSPGSLWLVGEMASKLPVRVGDNVQQLEMLWADGMLGVMPVFKTEGQARSYARMNDQFQGGRRDVWAVELVVMPKTGGPDEPK